MKSKQMFILPMLIVAFLFLLTLAANSLHPTRYIKCDTSKLTVEKAHLEDGEAVIEKIKIPKGTKVKVHQKQEYSSIIIHSFLCTWALYFSKEFLKIQALSYTITIN